MTKKLTVTITLLLASASLMFAGAPISANGHAAAASFGSCGGCGSHADKDAKKCPKGSDDKKCEEKKSEEGEAQE